MTLRTKSTVLVQSERNIMTKRAKKNATTARTIARARVYITEKLADDVREKLRAAGVRAEAIESINEDNVVEFLEEVVEGDAVIDDAATHERLRKALSNYRDTYINLPIPAAGHSHPRGNKPVKLKRAKGSLLRQIRAGITPAPPGYMTQADYMQEDEEAGKRTLRLRFLAKR